LLNRKWRSGFSRWSESCRSLIGIATLKRALIDCPKRYLNTRRHRRFRQQISLIRWFNPFHPDIRGNHGNIAVRGTSMRTGQISIPGNTAQMGYDYLPDDQPESDVNSNTLSTESFTISHDGGKGAKEEGQVR
jgi:hypothetical protein